MSETLPPLTDEHVADARRTAQIMAADSWMEASTHHLARWALQLERERDELRAFLLRLGQGGSIVPSSALTQTGIAIARAADRMLVTPDGLGYVFVPGPMAFRDDNQTELALKVGSSLDIDGVVDVRGVKYIGKATMQPNGKWRALAQVGRALCVVECSINFGEATPASDEAGGKGG